MGGELEKSEGNPKKDVGKWAEVVLRRPVEEEDVWLPWCGLGWDAK